MLEVIPSIDLLEGRLVRLEQGDYDRKTDFGLDPVEVAATFAAAGAPRIHVVDLDGARDGRRENAALIERIIAAAGEVPIQVGGGMRSIEAVEEILAVGADRIVLGTAAVTDPPLVRAAAERFPGRVILGLDVKDDRVAVHGWSEAGELRAADLIERYAGSPFAAILHTDVGRDGLLGGPNVDSTLALTRMTHLPVLASGGVGSLGDVLTLARTRVIAGVVIGRAIFSGRLDLSRALEEVARC